jgi:acyl carrier protein
MTEAAADIIVDWLRGLASRHPEAAITVDADLIAQGLLDSIEILNLVCFIEERFELVLPIEDFVPENFRTARAVAALVARLRPAQG